MNIEDKEEYKVLTPTEDGNWLTNGDTYSQQVLMPLSADTSVWSEITEDTKLQMEAEAQSQQQTDTDTETSTTTDTDTDDVLLKYVNDKTSSDYTDIGEAVKDLVDTATATD